MMRLCSCNGLLLLDPDNILQSVLVRGDLFLGNAKSRQLWLLLLQRQNKVAAQISMGKVTAQAAEIKSLKAQVKKLKKQARPFILHHKAWLRIVTRKNQNKKKGLKTSKRRSVFKQGRKTIKSSKDEGKTDKVDEKGESTAQQQSTDKQDEGTDMLKVSTSRTKLSTDKFEEGTAEPEPRESTSLAAQTTPTTYPQTFGDIAKFFDEIKALYEKVKRFDDSFITIGSTEDERKIEEMNEGASDPDKKKKIVKEDVSAKGDLKIMMESSIEVTNQGDFWNDQQDWEIVTWRLRIAKDVKETLRSDQDLLECLNTSSMKFKESTPKKHEVKQVQQSCLGEDSITLNKVVRSIFKGIHRYKTSKGYHVVPPPYIGNFMPPKSNLVLFDEDEYVFSESVTSIPDVATSEAKTSVSKPKYVSEPLIKDWISDSEDENETEFKTKQRKPSFAKVEFVKSKEHVKTPRESVKEIENNKQAKYLRKNSQIPRGNQRNWNKLMT
ncbi:hypothetical protein Tco_1106608 [Tanacetum coccineum]